MSADIFQWILAILASGLSNSMFRELLVDRVKETLKAGSPPSQSIVITVNLNGHTGLGQANTKKVTARVPRSRS